MTAQSIQAAAIESRRRSRRQPAEIAPNENPTVCATVRDGTPSARAPPVRLRRRDLAPPLDPGRVRRRGGASSAHVCASAASSSPDPTLTRTERISSPSGLCGGLHQPPGGGPSGGQCGTGSFSGLSSPGCSTPAEKYVPVRFPSRIQTTSERARPHTIAASAPSITSCSRTPRGSVWSCQLTQNR
jgi:hypothetical protein